MKVKVLCLMAVAVLVGANLGCGPSRTAGAFESGGTRTILVAMDCSKSMYLNDPSGLTAIGLQAMIALAPPGSRFGVLTYGEQAEVLAPVAALQTREDRERIAEAVSGIELKGKTDFDIAFRRSREIFSQTGAPEGSSLILLTDGQHNRGDAGVIIDIARVFSTNNWRINALAVTPSRRLSFLNTVTREGGGKVFRVRDAQASLNVSLQLAADADHMFAFLGDYSAVTVLPGTENVLLVAIKEQPSAGFASMNPLRGVSGDTGITRKSPSAYAYPPDLGGNGAFDVVNITSPSPGLYEIVTQGAAAESYVLSNLQVRVAFAQGSLKELYGESELVKVALNVDSDNPELYEAIKASGAVEVQATPKGPGNDVKKVLALSEVTEDGESSLVFTGDLALFAGGSIPVEFDLTAALRIDCAHEGFWLRKERATVKVTPGGSVLAVDPAEVDFGSHWSDEEVLMREFEVSSIYPGTVTVKVTGLPAELTATPPEFDVSDELKQKVGLALDPSKITEFRDLKFMFLLENTIAENNSRGIDFPVAAKVSIYKIEIPEKLTTAAHPSKKFSEVVTVTVTPPVKFKYELVPLGAGWGELKAEVEQGEDGAVSIAFDVPYDTPDGVYEGELKMTPEVEELSPRTVKVLLSVSGIPQLFIKPDKLTLEAQKSGWVEKEVTLSAEHYESLEFGLTINDISKTADMLISGQYDAEFVPGEGWDGKTMKSGEKYKGTLRFYISTDLLSGNYTGEAQCWITYRGGSKVAVKLPVSIKLKR